MSFAALHTGDRRLVILRLLAEDPDYAAGEAILQTALARFGHGVSRDQVRTDFAWLAEQELVTVEVVADSVHVARLTQRGADVAAGRASVPGVRRPGPGD
ncbi:MAG: ArsR family transcriptional regulator [Nitrospirota bacterium]|nr:ArsR family transcriptional regulator [Nitrospirota bacterium]